MDLYIKWSPACSLATLSLCSTHSANFKSCTDYKICLFFSPTWVAKHSKRNFLSIRIGALYIYMAFLSSSLHWVFTFQQIFYHWFAHAPVPFSDHSKNLESFPWVHHSVVDLTFCFTEKIVATTHELSSFLPLIAHLRLPVFSHSPRIDQSFFSYSFSLYSFSPGTFILMIDMFVALELSFEPQSLLQLPVTYYLFASQPDFCKSS